MTTPNQPAPLNSEFWWFVQDRIRKDEGGCWLWTSTKSDGYGLFNSRHLNPFTTRRAHRVIYQAVRGKLPQSVSLDHLCRNRACVNPEHMRCASNRENVLAGVGVTATNKRKTHCIRGHELSGKNIESYSRFRSCRACHVIRQRQYVKKRRANGISSR